MTHLISKYGNLVEMLENDETDMVIHQTNCFQTLGEGISSGIARALADQYPELKENELKAFKKGDINQLGKILINTVTTKSGKKKTVVNCYSQYYYGLVHGTSPTSYSAMEQCLKDLNLSLVGTDLRISTYQLGCTRGGADWNIVKDILLTTLTELNSLDIVTFKE